MYRFFAPSIISELVNDVWNRKPTFPAATSLSWLQLGVEKKKKREGGGTSQDPVLPALERKEKNKSGAPVCTFSPERTDGKAGGRKSPFAGCILATIFPPRCSGKLCRVSAYKYGSLLFFSFFIPTLTYAGGPNDPEGLFLFLSLSLCRHRTPFLRCDQEREIRMGKR